MVGGGISGLAAAWFLHRDAPAGTRVTVLEAGDRVGGVLRVSDLAGVPLDEGAESLLARRPEAVDLAGAVGLTLQDAATTSASVWSRGALHPLPPHTVMGVPTDLRALAATGILTPRELARVPLDAWLPRLPGLGAGADVSVGRYVAARLGRGVLDRLVEPLLGGVYAGRAERLSLQATLPQLWPHVRTHRSLLAAARASRAAAGHAGSPPVPGSARAPAVFAGPAGGVGLLPAAVARDSGAGVRTRATVRELGRAPTGWRVVLGPASAPERLDADAVVLAVPAAPAARLLRPEVPAAASELARVPAASMAVVALAFPAPSAPLPAEVADGSGFLVPPADRRVVKAVTFSSTKWRWVHESAPGMLLLRASVGRLGEEAALQREDSELVDLVLADLADALGITEPPVDARVTRWGGALPQYEVGHRARVDRVREAVQAVPGLAVCGAAYDGVGVAACVGTAEGAVAGLLRQWAGD